MKNNDKQFPIPVVAEGTGAPGSDEAWYAEPQEPLDGVDDVVLVASGKGGVGKSTVTVNLACALRRKGVRVGVLDADLYGPSIARMLGVDVALERDEQGRTLPACNHDIYAVSVANVVPPEAALAWKGPLVAQTLVQMFREVAWPNLDLLLVDLPPGTGDVQLTLLEQVPVSGAVIVTTPQQMALVDAERGVAMFHEFDIPVFGIVENMERYICPCCGEAQALFPSGGARALAARKHVAYLGDIPLDPLGQRAADEGEPLVLSHAEGEAATAFMTLSGQVMQALTRERGYRQREAELDSGGREQHETFWESLLD